MSLTKRSLEYSQAREREEILSKWYQALDEEYHENDPESGCQTCYEAIVLGIIPDREPEEYQEDPLHTIYQGRVIAK